MPTQGHLDTFANDPVERPDQVFAVKVGASSLDMINDFWLVG